MKKLMFLQEKGDEGIKGRRFTDTRKKEGTNKRRSIITNISTVVRDTYLND